MNTPALLSSLLLVVLAAGCSDMPTRDTTRYGTTSSAPASATDRRGTISSIENVAVDSDYKLGVGTAVGAVAGALLGSAVGDSKTATAVGAVIGGAAGTYGETKLKDKTVQKVSVDMLAGGHVTIVQPVDERLRTGMRVQVQGSGENARVVP